MGSGSACGRELCVDLGLLACRSDTGMPVMARLLIHSFINAWLSVFWSFAATRVCAVRCALISVCVAESASVGVKV